MYLYCYLSIGVITLIIICGSHYLSRQRQADDEIFDELDSLNPNKQKISYRILNNFVVPAIVLIFIVPLWPIAVYEKVKDIYQKTKKDEKIKSPGEDQYAGVRETQLEYEQRIERERRWERGFVVEHEHLLARQSIDQIEREEVVTDPLNAAPELPFGHLNGAWQNFLTQYVDGTELWSFAATWETPWDKEMRSGYVLVQEGVPGAHFLTAYKDIFNEA